MAEVQRGDVVLFTGQNHVRGIGEVGHVFRNKVFADAMWPPDAVDGSWHNVYSLLAFQPALIPYQPLREALGSNQKDNFQGLRLVRDHRVDIVLDVLGVRTITRDDAELNQALTTARTLENDLNIATSQLVAPERSQTPGGTYARTAEEVVFRRTEALLVSAYTAALPPDAKVSRTVCASGLTDLYIEYNSTFDLIEAKSSASHAHVRQALGQLLDYAYNTTVRITTLACLLPARPANADLELLNAYGIDCIYRTGPLLFAREAAPSTRRNVWDR
jgi:hypothetical protein